MTKRLAPVVLGLAAALALTACSSGSNTPAGDSSTAGNGSSASAPAGGGSADAATATSLSDFGSLAEYEIYRARLAGDDEARRNFADALESGCILAESRSFLRRFP